MIKISIFLLKIVLFLIESYAALIGGGIILDYINSFPGEMPRDLEITLKTILRFIEPEDMIDPPEVEDFAELIVIFLGAAFCGVIIYGLHKLAVKLIRRRSRQKSPDPQA